METPPSIWQSRKFWLTVVDLVVSVSTYFVTKYVSPESSKDILFLLAACQPVVITLIASYTYQNTVAMKARAQIDEAKAYAADK